nr:hypothetical protein [Haliscomenobacter sp.]
MIPVSFAAFQRTKRQLFLIDMSSRANKSLSNGKDILGGYSFSKDGKILAYSASSATTLSEIFKTPLLTFKPVQITNMSKQIATWKTAVSEVISWKSKDGAEIEGVLQTQILIRVKIPPPGDDSRRPHRD